MTENGQIISPLEAPKFELPVQATLPGQLKTMQAKRTLCPRSERRYKRQFKTITNPKSAGLPASSTFFVNANAHIYTDTCASVYICTSIWTYACLHFYINLFIQMQISNMKLLTGGPDQYTLCG